MNEELVFVLEPDFGRVTVEISQASKQAVDGLAADLGTRVSLNCAKPAENSRRTLPVLSRQRTSSKQTESDEFSIWLYRLYHHSTVDGPGRRSVVQVSGCSIRCKGFIYSLEGAKFDLAHEIHQHRSRDKVSQLPYRSSELLLHSKAFGE